MRDASKLILIVAHNPGVRGTRTLLLEQAGYTVSSVNTDAEAMAVLETDAFDLVLIGRNSRRSGQNLDQQVRERHPHSLILKIDGEFSPYPNRMTDAAPQHVLNALREMLS